MADEREQSPIEKLGREFVENELHYHFNLMATKRMANLLLTAFLRGAKAQNTILINDIETAVQEIEANKTNNISSEK